VYLFVDVAVAVVVVVVVVVAVVAVAVAVGKEGEQRIGGVRRCRRCRLVLLRDYYLDCWYSSID
jgi:hypothetical protein